MNYRLKIKTAKTLYKNVNTIVFWSIFVFLLPIIIFLILFDVSELDSINEFAALGSYIGGMYTFIIALLTSLTLITLLITYKSNNDFNRDQIEIANNELEINNFNHMINIINTNIKKMINLRRNI